MIEKDVDKKNNKQLFKAILPLSISIMLIFIIVFLSFSYSWIFKTYFSNIKGINISIVESQGLIMSIDDDITDTIDINRYLGDTVTTFSLKEASSQNGREIFLRDVGGYYYDINNIYDGVEVARDDIGIIQLKPSTEQDHNVNFLYFNFVLQSSGRDRYLIFNADPEESYIEIEEGLSSNPIRVSLTFNEDNSPTTKILGSRSEFSGYHPTKAVEQVDSSTKVGITSGQTVGTFEDYSGYENGVFGPARTLYYLEQGIFINVTVRIWLEGGDEDATDAIAASFLNISLNTAIFQAFSKFLKTIW